MLPREGRATLSLQSEYLIFCMRRGTGDVARLISILAAGVLSLLAAGCASSSIQQQQSTAYAEQLPRPARVVIYDFAGSARDVPPDSVIVPYYREPDVPQTREEAELGRRLARLVTDNLVRELNRSGIFALPADAAPVLHVGDAIVRGEFVTVNEGNRLARVLVGFGVGSAELQTLVEAYAVTANGLRPLGSAQIESAGGRMPGMLLPVGMGAAAGRAATSAAVSGGMNLAQEAGPESIEAAARRTAGRIAELIVDAYRTRGWL